LSEEIQFYSQRHLVEPGLTGWAQVNYGYSSSVKDAIQKLQYDLYYIKNVSLLFDIWIIFKTIRIVLFGYGREMAFVLPGTDLGGWRKLSGRRLRHSGHL